jgi:hypothetical protein
MIGLLCFALAVLKSHAILGGLHHHYALSLSFRYTQESLVKELSVADIQFIRIR